jgi:hypothetical protein
LFLRTYLAAVLAGRVYHAGMRKLLTVLLLLFGGLVFGGQAVASVAVGYDDCCLHGCKGMTQCANAACQSCAAPQPAPPPGSPAAPVAEALRWRVASVLFDAGLRCEPWTPPD